MSLNAVEFGFESSVFRHTSFTWLILLSISIKEHTSSLSAPCPGSLWLVLQCHKISLILTVLPIFTYSMIFFQIFERSSYHFVCQITRLWLRCKTIRASLKINMKKFLPSSSIHHQNSLVGSSSHFSFNSSDLQQNHNEKKNMHETNHTSSKILFLCTYQ